MPRKLVAAILARAHSLLKRIVVAAIGAAALAASTAVIVTVFGHNYEEVFKYRFEIPTKVWLQETFFSPNISEERLL